MRSSTTAYTVSDLYSFVKRFDNGFAARGAEYLRSFRYVKRQLIYLTVFSPESEA